MSAVVIAHNIEALTEARLSDYVMPSYTDLVDQLQRAGFWFQAKPSDMTFAQCLEQLAVPLAQRDMSALELLSQPLDQQDSRFVNCAVDDLQAHCDDELFALLSAYLQLLPAVFTSPLALRQYDVAVANVENVSEQQHGLQSATLAWHLGLDSVHVLAAGLHDLARMTHEQALHGHQHHAREGDILLAPLQLPRYCLHHAFAKWLLTMVSETYRATLLSPVSAQSLQLQADKPAERFANQAALLNAMTSADEQAGFLFELMFMRLVMDDFAKCPVSLINRPGLQVEQLYQLVVARFMDVLSEGEHEILRQQLKMALPYFLRVAHFCDTGTTLLLKISHLLDDCYAI